MSRRRRDKRRDAYLKRVCEAVEAGAVRPDEWYFQCANGDFIGAWGTAAADIWACLDEILRAQQNTDIAGLSYDDVQRAVKVQGVWESSRERGRRKLYQRVM